jgi:hypothetical protein
MDYFRMNANVQIEKRLNGIQSDLEDVGTWSDILTRKLLPLDNEIGCSKALPGCFDERGWPKRFEDVQVNRTVFDLKSVIALDKISKIITEVRWATFPRTC